MATLFENKISKFLFNSFKNQATNENILNRTINEANDLYSYLTDRFGNVINMSDKEVEKTKLDLNRFKSTKNKISNIVNAITKEVNNVNDIIKIVLTIINLCRTIIRILRNLPIPAQFLTSGVIVSFSDKLQKADRKIETLEKIISAVRPFINIILNLLSKIRILLNTLDQIIALIEAFLAARNEKFLQETKEFPTINLITAPNNNIIGFYNGFTFELREENDPLFQVGDIKRHYAVALNNQGIVAVKSQSSFASDPQVLVDELKFLIDTRQLKA